MAENKVFLDTNILIYAYSNTETDKKEKVMGILSDDAVCFSTQVINEFIWVMNRKYKVNMDSLRIITNNLFEMYVVSLVDRATIGQAIDIASRYKYSYWDSLIVSSSIESGCDILYTEDMQHGQVVNNGLRILNPFA